MYRQTNKWSTPSFFTYEYVSLGSLWKPVYWSYLSILLFHACGPCFRPYKAFWSLHIFYSAPFVSYPLNCFTYTSSANSIRAHIYVLDSVSWCIALWGLSTHVWPTSSVRLSPNPCGWTTYSPSTIPQPERLDMSFPLPNPPPCTCEVGQLIPWLWFCR